MRKWLRSAAGLLALLTAVATVIVTPAALAQLQSGSSQVSVGNLDETGTTHWCSARPDWH